MVGDGAATELAVGVGRADRVCSVGHDTRHRPCAESLGAPVPPRSEPLLFASKPYYGADPGAALGSPETNPRVPQ